MPVLEDAQLRCSDVSFVLVNQGVFDAVGGAYDLPQVPAGPDHTLRGEQDDEEFWMRTYPAPAGSTTCAT